MKLTYCPTEDLYDAMLKRPREMRKEDFYKQYYYSTLWELQNNGTCGRMHFLMYQLCHFSRPDVSSAVGNAFTVNFIEWQVYRDIYRKCKKGKGRLPSLDDIVIPERITVIEGLYEYDWNNVGDDFYIITVTDLRKLQEKMKKVIYYLLTVSYRCNNTNEVLVDNISGKTEKEDSVHSEREKILKSAHEKSEELLSQAREKEKKILENAGEESYKIVKQAEEKSKKILEHAEEVRKQAENDAIDIRKKAQIEGEQEAHRNAQNLVRKYMTAELNNNWTNLRQAIETEDATNQEELTRGEREREDIWAKVSIMQGDLVKAIEDAVANVTQVKQNICHELGEWRSSLHVDQFKDMIRVYTGLFRLHNDLNGVFSDAFSSTQLPEESKNEIAEETDLLISNLGMLERQMDRALSVFGMYAVRPENGMLFDSDYHELTDKQQDEGITNGDGHHILRCVIPGVAQRYNEETRDDRILCKAKVEVDQKS